MKSLKIDLAWVVLIALGAWGSSTSDAATFRSRVEAGRVAYQEIPFTNEDVVTMLQAGFATETIIEAIRSKEPGFDTSVETLIALKKAGVGEEIIVAMIAAAGVAADRSSVADSEFDDGLPSEDGVYALKEGGYVPLEDERIEWRSGLFSGITTRGSLRTTALNARLKALHSPFELSSRPEILLVCEACESAFDYHLVLANDDEDKREFRISFQIMQGPYETYVARGGTGKERMEYDAEEIAPGKYQLELPALAPGDYAFLPPSEGAHPQSLAVSVMHTFRLIAP